MANRSDTKKSSRWLSAVALGIFAVVVSFVLNFVSERISTHVSPYLGVPLLAAVIALGVVADVVGVACTRAREPSLLSMASRRIRGAREALWFVRNAGLVSSVANDFLGDVCSTVAGALAVGLSFGLAAETGLERSVLAALVVGLCAGLAVGGKAWLKGIGLRHAESIVHRLGLISWFLGRRSVRRNPGSEGIREERAGRNRRRPRNGPSR